MNFQQWLVTSNNNYLSSYLFSCLHWNNCRPFLLFLWEAKAVYFRILFA